MELLEILQNAPKDSQMIADSIVITHAKLKRYDKILCSISGGSDSDILIDLCEKFDESSKITYVFLIRGSSIVQQRNICNIWNKSMVYILNK